MSKSKNYDPKIIYFSKEERDILDWFKEKKGWNNSEIVRFALWYAKTGKEKGISFGYSNRKKQYSSKTEKDMIIC